VTKNYNLAIQATDNESEGHIQSQPHTQQTHMYRCI